MVLFFKYKRVDFIVLTMTLPALFPQPLFAQQAGSEKLLYAWQVRPFYKYRTDGTPGRVVDFYVKGLPANGPVTVTITCDPIIETVNFKNLERLDSFCKVSVLLPEGIGVTKETTVHLLVSTGDKGLPATVAVPAKKQWTVFIYPHSHLDIGYTALPDDVKKLHLRNIDVGIDLAKKTEAYPEGSRFVWNPEATWVVMNYLKEATPQQKQTFISAVKKGWVQIDGGHSNCNTSTFSDEEFIRFFTNAALLKEQTGVPVTTVVQMDVPGVAWGFVQTASQFGIKGIISFPNYFDLRKQREHKPFYWLAPDGKTKTLFLQGFPYGIGYTLKGSKYGLSKLQAFSPEYDRVSTATPMKDFLDPFIFDETNKLEKAGSPYDLFAMTWSMADNCVIDADLPEAVRQWNQTYAYPKLVISGAKQILDAYEKKYASVIPTYRGDFTEFWTNGLGSNAAAVGLGRRAKESLVQAEVLSAVLNANISSETVEKAWEDQLLSAEHTWGAQDSKSLLAQQVERMKAGYFVNAEKEAGALIEETLAPFRDTTVAGFSVLNTLSWERNGIVTLSKVQSRFGDAVLDEHNKPVLSQRLSTGELLFQAEGVPALGSKFYKVVKQKEVPQSGLQGSVAGLKNDLISVAVDPVKGTISSLKNVKTGYEYADTAVGLNRYQYVTGVYNGKDVPAAPATDHNVSVRVKEKGPLLVSLTVTSKAEGVTSLRREIRLYHHRPTVEIVNTLDKISTPDKEGIHFGFGFQLPDAVGRVDMPWSIVRPGADQLDGANKNWLTFQRWVDLSNNDHGITWTAIESPLIEWGGLSGNILDGARQHWLWQKEVPQSSTFYSWPLNNHWDTNFPLEQGGIVQQQYAVTVHEGYDAVAATRFGTEAHRPLVVVQTAKNVITKPLVQIINPGLVLSTLQRPTGGKAFLLRVKSISGKPEKLRLAWPAGKPKELIECSADGVPVQKASDEIEVAPFGMTSLRLAF